MHRARVPEKETVHDSTGQRATGSHSTAGSHRSISKAERGNMAHLLVELEGEIVIRLCAPWWVSSVHHIRAQAIFDATMAYALASMKHLPPSGPLTLESAQQGKVHTCEPSQQGKENA